MKPLNDALEALGELFIMGLSGFEISPETSSWITRSKMGGIILFSHNYETPAQLVEFSTQIPFLFGLLWIKRVEKFNVSRRDSLAFRRHHSLDQQVHPSLPLRFQV